MSNIMVFTKNKILLLLIGLALFVSSCEKNSNVDPKNEGTVNIGITDARVSQTTKSGIQADKLTKFEITIAGINLKNEKSELIQILSEPIVVDLRQFQGELKTLGGIDIPLGTYSELSIAISAIKVSYAGNTYSSSVSGSAALTLSELPGMTFTSAHGVPDYFSSEIVFNIPLSFDLTEENKIKDIRVQLDVLPSCEEITFDCPVCSGPQLFAGIKNNFFFSIIFEEGIQQIKHSPPLGISLAGVTDVNYYGIHTFIDFNSVGGTINSHTSQHVYRGEDGNLLVDVENMEINNATLSPSTIAATGETDVRADEIFHYSEYNTKLTSLGYQLGSGTTYYFSLRKTWNITSNGATYEITRLCEPIPVVWP